MAPHNCHKQSLLIQEICSLVIFSSLVSRIPGPNPRRTALPLETTQILPVLQNRVPPGRKLGTRKQRTRMQMSMNLVVPRPLDKHAEALDIHPCSRGHRQRKPMAVLTTRSHYPRHARKLPSQRKVHRLNCLERIEPKIRSKCLKSKGESKGNLLLVPRWKRLCWA